MQVYGFLADGYLQHLRVQSSNKKSRYKKSRNKNRIIQRSNFGVLFEEKVMIKGWRHKNQVLCIWYVVFPKCVTMDGD
jgi:hypothetical protein